MNRPSEYFHQCSYLEINFRRLEHLSSLGFSFRGKNVAELGAGIGDLSPFFMTQGANLTIIEGRPENLEVLQRRYPPEKYPAVRIVEMDLNSPRELPDAPFDIVFCYGILYHLKNPEEALDFMAAICGDLLLLETCVSPHRHHVVDKAAENVHDPTQALNGSACRPGRNWLYKELSNRFKYVYLPQKQPDYEEYLLDWESPQPAPNGLARAIFVASRNKLQNTVLSSELPSQQCTIRKKMLHSTLERVLARPPIIELETINVCNSRCTFCPSRSHRRKKQPMSKELFQKVPGNLNKQSLSDILISPARKRRIFSFMLGKAPAYCARCSFYKPDMTIDWRMLFVDTESPSPFSPGYFVEFSVAKRRHFKIFSGLDRELYGWEADPNSCNLKIYQDLLVYSFVRSQVPSGARILEVGGGDSRVLKKLSADYECWNLDKLEGIGYGPHSLESPPYRIVRAYAGDFSKELPDDYFDFVFSISALEHTPAKNSALYDKIVADINRVLKKGGYSLHCFDVVLNVGLVTEYYDYVYYEGSLEGQPESDELNRFATIPRGHGPKCYCPDIVPHFFKVPFAMAPFPDIEQVAIQRDTWTMSKEAFDAGWKPTVKKDFFHFGKPTSLNVLWQK